MSKSKGNTIGVLETPEQIWAKVAPAKTDPARVRRTDPGTPEKCTIWSYHLLVTPEPERAEIHDGCTTAGIGCIDCKKRFQANLMKVLDPIRDRYAELSGSGRKEVDGAAGRQRGEVPRAWRHRPWPRSRRRWV